VLFSAALAEKLKSKGIQSYALQPGCKLLGLLGPLELDTDGLTWMIQSFLNPILLHTLRQICGKVASNSRKRCLEVKFVS
jgi:hypothetical protein